jgi:hypothetical protein
MPRISSFYGIVIWMYHDEIHPRGRPHFHASYGDDEVSIEIESLTRSRRRDSAPGDAAGGRVGACAPGRAARQLASCS